MVCFQQLSDSKQIETVLTLCSPFFHNQSKNNSKFVTAQAEKFAKNAVFTVAVEDDSVIGFCAYYANDYKTCRAYLSMVVVSSYARGRGIGSALLKHMIQDCKSKGMRLIQLEVANNNTVAIRFYQKHKFKLSGGLSETSSMYELNI